MDIIKLDAIESTNSYIKKIGIDNPLNNYTVVWAEEQTKGRGQLGSSWSSESGKNLTISILIRFSNFMLSNQFYLSMAISLGIREVLCNYISAPIHIKWPNDILAGKGKIAGILIENIIAGNLIKQSIIGIGLNVNQDSFPNGIGNPISLKMISGINIDRNTLLNEIILSIQHFVSYVETKQFSRLRTDYLSHLYKINKPSMFIDLNELTFMGKITGVTEEGRLLVELENETTREFDLKEIKFASR